MNTDRPGPKIQIGTACYGGVVTTGYMMSLIKLMQYALTNGFEVSIDIIGGDSLITRLRNTLVSRFFHVGDATHFMFVDADIAFEPHTVHRMLTFDQDVVAGAYPVKALRWGGPETVKACEPAATASLQYVGQVCDGDELERRGPFATGRHCGAGFMLINRRAVERLIAAHPECRYDSDHVYALNRAKQPYYALFECMIDPQTREYLSEDLAFCQRWRALDGKIWLDLEASLTHTGPYRFEGRPALRFPREAIVAAVGTAK
jgi:hypothetical protein